MLYKGIQVLEVSTVVFIKEHATDKFKENERYVLNKLVEAGFENFGVENPIDDVVFIYFDDKDWTKEAASLARIYETLNKVFEEVKINIYLDGHIEGIGNNVDLTLEQFLNVVDPTQKFPLNAEKLKDLNVGDKLYWIGQKKPFTIKARNDRYIIATRPMFGEAEYTIIDIQELVCGPNNFVFNIYDYKSDKEILESLYDLEKGNYEISHRRRSELFKCFDKFKTS